MATPVSKSVLKTLVPIKELNSENFLELSRKAFVEDLPPKRRLFKSGDKDRKLIYLVEGRIEVTGRTGARIVIDGDSEIAKHPIANHQPRQHAAVTVSASKITRIDMDLMDLMLTWEQSSQAEAGEITASNGTRSDMDWMTRVLQSRAFKQIPPANIQAMFMRMQEEPVKKDQTIIKQGDPGDAYYTIQRGTCQVMRHTKAGGSVLLATLGAGDAFGEEALISDGPRNADVIMSSDGMLMKLSKEDFEELLKEPVLSWVDSKKAADMFKEGNTVLIDVRLESEHKNSRIKGSHNIPLFLLRAKMDKMPKGRRYILYCDTGRRSSAGTFLLNQEGFNAYCLRGGLVQNKPQSQ